MVNPYSQGDAREVPETHCPNNLELSSIKWLLRRDLEVWAILGNINIIIFRLTFKYVGQQMCLTKQEPGPKYTPTYLHLCGSGSGGRWNIGLHMCVTCKDFHQINIQFCSGDMADDCRKGVKLFRSRTTEEVWQRRVVLQEVAPAWLELQQGT